MTEPTEETVRQFADQLRQYAEHFAQHDWDYTRQHSIKYIREVGDYRGYNAPHRRLGRALGVFLPALTKTGRANRETEFGNLLKTRGDRLAIARVYLRTEPHLPDGVLDNGCIITHWEETGEYLQYVQPSVGSMLADWLEAEPSNPHALRIAGEMRRINARYGERVAASEAQS